MKVTDTILEQLGGGSIEGALAYCGVKAIGTDEQSGLVKLHTNSFEPGEMWVIEIRYMSGQDLYRVTSYKKQGPHREQKENLDGVFCDQLQSVVEALYDDMLGEYEHTTENSLEGQS